MKKASCILFLCAVLFAGMAQAADEGEGSAAKGSAAKTEAPAPKAETAAPKAEAAGSAAKEAAPDKAPADENRGDVLLETSKGNIVIRLFDDTAPEHAKSFRSLARKGFYDGTYFHRVVDGFVVQGGDPNTKDDNEMNDGQGGPGYTIKNEANPKWTHKRGRVAAARTPDLDSAGSQFYICLKDLPQLDQMKYTVFGEVVSGLDVVDKIASVPKKSVRFGGERSFPVDKTYIKKAKVISPGELDALKKETD